MLSGTSSLYLCTYASKVRLWFFFSFFVSLFPSFVGIFFFVSSLSFTLPIGSLSIYFNIKLLCCSSYWSAFKIDKLETNPRDRKCVEDMLLCYTFPPLMSVLLT
ncbi:unnamed protein product [Linum tenue]|uniref:Uncharacterized protein n=1 Tax=Linum tenue TaxID=586396 RepID=A0AAV0JRS2_9ROSI|nr:unnamed protein product [Linum tenue]